MYIIVSNKRAGGTSKDLSRCMKVLESMPGVSIKKVVGEATNLKRLHVDAPLDAVEKVRQEFGSRLIIESDRPLEPLG